MEKDEKIYLDKKGYEKYLKGIEALKAKLAEVNAGRRDAFDAGAGDGWDSPEFEEIERQERMVMGELQHRYEELTRIVIVEKHNEDEIIDIGDTLVTDMIYSADDSEELIFTLVGTDGNMHSEIQEVSINSPLGKSVYKKKIGDTCTYSVNGRQFSVLLKDKIDLEEDKEMDKNVKKLSK